MPAGPFGSKKGSTKWPLDKMECGDSFLVSNTTAANVYAQVSRIGKRLGRVFTVRTAADKTVRVWRVS